MSSNTALIAEMAILVGIFLLGFVAKMFPKRQGSRDEETRSRANQSLTQR